MGKVAVKGEYLFFRALFSRYYFVPIPKKYVVSILKLCRDTEDSKTYYKILRILEEYGPKEHDYQNIILGVLTNNRNSRYVDSYQKNIIGPKNEIYCKNFYDYHPFVYLHFHQTYRVYNPLEHWQFPKKRDPHRAWILRFYRLCVDDLVKKAVPSINGKTLRPSDDIFNFFLTTSNDEDGVGYLKGFLDATPLKIVLIAPTHFVYSKEIIEVLIGRENVLLENAYSKMLLVLNNYPAYRLVLDVLETDPKIKSFAEKVEAKKALFKSRRTLLPQDDPLYQEILEAMKRASLSSLTRIYQQLTSEDKRVFITFRTRSGAVNTFFLNEKALKKFGSVGTLIQNTPSETMVSDYAYDFHLDPVVSVSVSLLI
jgi:hypothetical protein